MPGVLFAAGATTPRTPTEERLAQLDAARKLLRSDTGA